MEIIMANLTQLLLIALLSETLTEIIKSVFPENVIKDKITYITSIVVGVGLAFAFDFNLLGLEGIAKYVSIVAAGLIASRGANYVNGFMKKFDILK